MVKRCDHSKVNIEFSSRGQKSGMELSKREEKAGRGDTDLI